MAGRSKKPTPAEREGVDADRRGVHAELYLFGGGAMVLAYNARVLRIT